MTFAAAISFIWTLGVKSERKTLDNKIIKEDINEIKTDIDELEKYSKKLDTLILFTNQIKETQDEIIKNQNAMRDSYVKLLVNDETLVDKSLFLEYMEGLEFRLKSNVDIDTLNYTPSISAKPIKKE